MIKIEDVYKWHDTKWGGYYASSEDDAYINENMIVKITKFTTNIDKDDNKGKLTLIYLLGNIGRGINGTDGIKVVTGLSPKKILEKIGG